MFNYYNRHRQALPYFLMFLVGLTLGVFVDRQFLTEKLPIINPVNVNLTIKAANNEIVDFQNLEVMPGSSVFDLMSKLVSSSKISWQTENRDDGKYISSLQDKGNQSNAEFWHCYINSQPCVTSLEKLKLQGQEHIEWKYEK